MPLAIANSSLAILLPDPSIILCIYFFFVSYCSLATLQLAVDSIVLTHTHIHTHTHTGSFSCETVYANAINYILL